MLPQKHRDRLLKKFQILGYMKYNRGYKEHGGNMQSMTPLQLLYEARSENIDQFFYIQDAIDKLEGEKA